MSRLAVELSRRLALAGLVALAVALTGCGSAKAGSAIEVAGTTADGHALARLGFGAEGGEKPALVRRAAGGYVLAYAGTRSGSRKIYVATSADGTHWAKPKVACAGEFSDQAPALAEDAAGQLHLFFASNRSGEAQALYHAVEANGAFGQPAAIAGFEGAQDLAIARGEHGFTLVAEVLGAGLLAASSPDGVEWTTPGELAPAGAEPAAAALPDGRTLVAYQLEGKIWLKAGKPGDWAAASEAASGGSRLRDPGLAWAGATGLLVYCEKGAAGFELKARSLDASFRPAAADAPLAGSGDQRGVAIALDHNGSKTFAWGMKTTSGQQGVMVSTH